MKTEFIILLIDNIWLILFLIAIIVGFFIYFDKKNNVKHEKIDKNFDSSRLDIVSSKVQVIMTILIIGIGFLIYSILN